MSEGLVLKADGNKTLEQMRAEVAAFEADPVGNFLKADSTPAPEAVPAPATPEKAAEPESVTPTDKAKAEPTQQPKETPEQAAKETPKAAEPVKVTDWQAAYKELQRKYNKAFVEKKSEPKVETQTETPEEPFVITPQKKKQIAEDLEKDPVETLVKLSREIARMELHPVKSKVESAEAEKAESARLEGLERLVKEGHDWLQTPEGLQKIDQVFQENQELWKTKDPYRAALGFVSDVPSKAQQRSPAPTTGLTPMLGAGGAVPPVVSTPAVSTEVKLMNMQKEVEALQKRGKFAEARTLMSEMDAIQRG